MMTITRYCCLPTLFPEQAWTTRRRPKRPGCSGVGSALAQTYELYWQHLSVEGLDLSVDPAGACERYLRYMNRHTQLFREELRAAGRRLIFQFHEKEAKLEHELRWLTKVVSAYSFHRQSAEIQSAECQRQIRELQPGSCIIWLDWSLMKKGLYIQL